MNIPKVSICIPTRNRKELLSGCLKSIFEQSTDAFEIVIIDGNSSDGTKEMIFELQKKYLNITYIFQETHNGIARDVVNSIVNSNGDYCWMLSDDDRLDKNALSEASLFLSKNKELSGISVSYDFFDKSMTYRIKSMRPSRNKIQSKAIKFNSIEDTFEEIGHHLGFLSGQILKRDEATKVINNCDLTPFLNPWIIINLIGLVLKNNPNWAYLNLPLVLYRSGNDSFLSNGVYKRQLITHEVLRGTYLNFFHKDSKTFKILMSSLVNIRMPRALAVIKANKLPMKELYLIFKLYIKHYSLFIGFWLKVFPIFLVPGFIINLVRWVYNSLKIIHSWKK